MTLEYERLGLVIPEATLEAAVMHWSHSVVGEKNFVSFWHAQQNASDLALELGVPEGLRIDVFSLPPRKKPHRGTVTFSEEVQLYVDEEDYMEFQPVLLRHEELSQWDSKPWQLRPVPIASDGPLPAPHAAPEEHDGRHPSRQGTRPVPAWHHDIRVLLNEEGQTEEAEEGKVLYVSSHFIDHQRHRFHDQARILRFEEDETDWENDIRFIWEDLADPSIDVEIILVRPAPPFLAFRGTMAAVIVQQRPQPDRAACLVTAVLPLSPDFRVIVTAHSTTLTVMPQEVIRLAGVEQACVHRLQNGFGPCALLIGLQRLDPTQPLQITTGLGITIRVPPPMSDEETEHNVNLRYGRPAVTPERTVNDEPEAEPEDTSLMARRPRPRQEMSRSSSGASSSSSSTSESSCRSTHSEGDPPHMKRAVVFPIHGAPISLLLPWDDGEALFQRVAEAFELQPSDVRDIHYVPHRPSDLALQELHALLLQRLPEPRPSTFLRLVLVDIETYEDDLLQPSAFQRFTKWLPQTLNRPSILRMLDLELIAEQYASQTRIWLNHCLIDETRHDALQLRDGDYLKVFIGDSACDNIRLSDVELPELPGSDLDSERLEEDEWGVLRTDQISLMQNFTRLQDMLRPTRQHAVPPMSTCKVDAWQAAAELSPTIAVDGHIAHRDDLPHGTRGQMQRDESIRHLWSHSSKASSSDDDARRVPFDTWYLNGQDYRQCDAPRTVELPRESSEWDDIVIQAWPDRFDVRFNYRIVLVRPTSEPCQHGGHLLLMQRESPGDHGVIISRFWHEATSRFDGRFARVLPRRLTFQRLLRHVRLDYLCNERYLLCLAYQGHIHLDGVNDVTPQTGNHFEIHASPWAYLDSLNLIQYNVTLMRPPTDALEADPPDRGEGHAPCDRPRASISTNQPLPLDRQSEFVQNLFGLWQPSAFAWGIEERSAQVVTY